MTCAPEGKGALPTDRLHLRLTLLSLDLGMLNTFSLISPVLIPSWKFFKSIEPSPRIEWCWEEEAAWRELRPLPQRMSLLRRLMRLFWNPEWNEKLFLVSCAERIKEAPTEHSIAVIRGHVRAYSEGYIPTAAANALRFRLVFVQRTGSVLSQEVVFVSEAFPVTDVASQ